MLKKLCKITLYNDNNKNNNNNNNIFFKDRSLFQKWFDVSCENRQRLGWIKVLLVTVSLLLLRIFLGTNAKTSVRLSRYHSSSVRGIYVFQWWTDWHRAANLNH